MERLLAKYTNSYAAYVILFFFYDLAFAFFSALISVYLIGKGYSASQVSLLISVAALANMITQPVIGSLTDKYGTLVPDAADQLSFDVTGAGRFEAVCNGDATSLETFTKPTMKLFNGQLVVVVRAAKQAGTLTLKVTDKKRKITNSISIEVQ